MALRVNKKLGGLENIFALVQHTFADQTDLLTPDNIVVENVRELDGQLQVDLVAASNEVTGTKTVTYTATDLATANLADVLVDSPEEGHTAILAQLDGLACLSSEIEVQSPVANVDDENVFTVEVVALTDSFTVFGRRQLNINIKEYPFDLTTELEGEQLDGFGQVLPVVRSVELPESADIVLGEDDTFQFGMNYDGDEVYALELDIHIANPADPLRAKEQFTVYASEENPYGNSRDDFEAMGVSVVFADGSWSIDFGPAVSAAMAASGEVRIYSALRDDAQGKLWGDMMAPTAEMVRKFNISYE